MPRKRRSTDGKLSNRCIKVYASDEEKERLRTYAGTLSLSEYLLGAALKTIKVKYPPRPPIPRVNREMLLAMGRIGNSLNQLARAGNQAKQMGLEWNLDPAPIEELRTELKQIAYAIADIQPEDIEEAEQNGD